MEATDLVTAIPEQGLRRVCGADGTFTHPLGVDPSVTGFPKCTEC